MEATQTIGEGTVTESPKLSDDADTSALPLLTEAIMSVPLPGAPPRLHTRGAEIGLAFVDGALRQNHVRRVSEILRLAEHGAALQTVRVDVSLSLLNEGQYKAGRRFSRLRGTYHPEADNHRHDPEDHLLWVPITKLSRRSVSPLEVLDGNGNQVPRLTQGETSRLMAPAMYRLLRAILHSDPDAVDPARPLYKLLHTYDTPRWLIQRALLALTTERANPLGQQQRYARLHNLDNPSNKPRRFAVEVLKDKEEALDEYLRLLHVVLSNYFVIVGLRDDVNDHTLTISSPLESVDNDRGRLWRSGTWIRQRLDGLRHASNAYDVQYRTRLPTGVQTYHFAAEADLDLTIDPLFLTTDFDVQSSRRLAADLKFLAAHMDAFDPGSGSQRILELEVDAALGRLSELVRRRKWEAQQATGAPMLPSAAQCCQLLHEATADFEQERNADGRPENLLQSRHVDAKVLEKAAEELDTYQLGSDLSAENDPASSRAHAYWRRPQNAESSIGTIDVTCHLRVTDATEARPRHVAYFVGSVAGLNLLMALLLFQRVPLVDFGRPLEFGAAGVVERLRPNADAIVAVLLLVPGFLYTRLHLPSALSIAGRLRAFARTLAYTVIGTSAAVAAMVASGIAPIWIEAGIWTAVLIDFTCLRALRSFDHRHHLPLRVPAWVRGRPRAEGPPMKPVDVTFLGVGTPQELSPLAGRR